MKLFLSDIFTIVFVELFGCCLQLKYSRGIAPHYKSYNVIV